MSRAALLPTPGDPYIFASWLNNYTKRWSKEVDKLYVHFNSRLEDPVIKYSINLAESCGADCSYEQQWKGHGEALKVIFDRSTEDYVVFAEDDGYVLFEGVVDKLFSKLENDLCDCVTNPRGSINVKICEREQQYFNLKGEEFHKPNFWPCFFFAHRDVFKGTDYNFGTKNWQQGDIIHELGDYLVPENGSGDTLSWMSIQLRNKGLRFFQLEDGRSTTQDYWLYDRKMGIFATPPIAPWIHFGSTSSGISNSLLDDEMKPLENRINGVPTSLPVMPDDHIRDDYARRIALWKLCWECFQIPDNNPASYFNEIYGRAIERTIEGCGIDRSRLNKYMTIYRDYVCI